jgi:hypothetical protein
MLTMMIRNFYLLKKMKVIELRLEIIYFLSPLFRSSKVTTESHPWGASSYIARDINKEYRNEKERVGKTLAYYADFFRFSFNSLDQWLSTLGLYCSSQFIILFLTDFTFG